jgi:hypothetical protein
VRSSAYAWEWGFEGMRPIGPGVPAFGAHMNVASPYAKLPQMQPGYFAVSPGGNVDHSVTNNVVNDKTDVHVDGSIDPEITARMVGSHIIGQPRPDQRYDRGCPVSAVAMLERPRASAPVEAPARWRAEDIGIRRGA